jgi:tetratricopeptide (TPR) repeat protein
MPRAVIVTTHLIACQAVCAHLTERKQETHSQGTVYELGKFSADEQTWEIAIAEIDNSNTSSALETERAISHFKPDVICLVGVAAGIKDVLIGDVVVATKIYGYESGKEERKFLPRPEVQQPSYQLRERARGERRKIDWLNRIPSGASNSSPSILLAPIASGEKEVADEQAELLDFLRALYGDAVALENSGFGFLKAAMASEKVFALAIHGITHLINTDTENIQTDSRAIALQNASAFTFEVLAKLKIDDAGNTERIRGIVSYGIPPDELYAEIGQRIGKSISNKPSGLNDERHKRIDHARTLINQGKFSQTVQYLEALREEIWSQADHKLKYRLLANLGMAKLGLDEISDGAAKFLEALQYNLEDDQAIAYAAMGYMFQGDHINAEKLIKDALQRNPANELAHSLRIRIIPVTESIESVLEQIPNAYNESPDVLVALGEAALNRGLYDKADKWWQSALSKNNGNGMDSVKVALGSALLETIAQDYPLIAAGQLSDSQKCNLERATTLFTEVIKGDYTDPNDLTKTKSIALINRSGAFRLLGRYDESIRDLEMARQKEPDDPYLIKQRALLAHEKGNEEEAYEYAQQILLSPKTPEAFLLASSSLIELNRANEAEDLLNRFLQIDISKTLKHLASCFKFDILLDRDNRQSAETILQEINSDDPDGIFTIIKNIRWKEYIGLGHDVPELIQKAKSALVHKNDIFAQIILSDLLYSLSYYRDAAEIYESFINKTIYSSFSRRLVESYYLAGNYKEALNLCHIFLDKNDSLEIFSEMAAYIYEYIGDMGSAQKICEDYLKVYSNDVDMQLRLARIYYATGDHGRLDQFLDAKPNIEGLSFELLKNLSHLYKFRNRISCLLETIYEIRHRFYDDKKAHVFYQISYLEAMRHQEIQSFDAVIDGCGVLLINESGKEHWYILEDRPDAEFAKYELNSPQSLYQALIGKRLGEEIILAEDGFGRNALKIVAITDKYCAAGKQSLSVLENQPDLQDFRILRIPMDGDNFFPEFIQNFIEGLEQHKKHFDRIKADYVSGNLPFSATAVLWNRNPIETWHLLAFGPNPFFHAWFDFRNEKFEDALITLQKGGIVVIDPISLITLHHLGVADDVVRILGKFGIAQSTIDLFHGMIEMSHGFQREGFATVAVEKGQGIWHEFTSEHVEQRKIAFERITEWIRQNCLVLPCGRALDITKDERNKLIQHIGSAFIDTALIAGEPGRILYSDDQWLRRYARLDSAVPGVWTQVVLKYCLVCQNSNESLYHQASLKLASHGYGYTVIDSEMLIEAVRMNGWKPQPIYTSALRALADENTRLEYTISVSGDFLHKLYLQFVVSDTQFIDPRDTLVFELLTILTEKRSMSVFIESLKRTVRQRFNLIPLQQRDVLEVITAWLRSQSFTT